MAWIDELKRRDANPVVCVEVVLAETTLYYADADLEDGTTFWEGRVTGGCVLTRGVDPEGAQLNVPDVTVIFDNNTTDPTDEGHFGPLLRDYRWENQTVNIYLKFVRDGVIYSQEVFSGLAVPEELTPTQFRLRVRPAFLETYGLVQRTITKTSYTNAPDGTGAKKESTIGQGMNIILGTVAASGRGAVKLQMVDQTTNAEKFAVASHWVSSIDAVYKKRADAYTLLTAGGTDYTAYPDTGTDAEGNEYSYITLASGEWAEGDEFYANVKGLMTGGYIDLDGSTEHLYHADHADFDITGDLTIETVVYPAVVTGNRKIVCKASGAGQESYWIDFLNSTLRFVATGNGTTHWVVTVPAGVFSAATWTRIKVVYDASATEVSIYKDGTEIARANNVTQTGCTLTGTITGAIHSGTAQLMIGAYGSSASPSLYYSGRIASVGIWAVESDTGTSLAYNDANVKGFWKFAGNANDSSGKGHNLTGVNIAAADYSTDYANPYKSVLAGNPARGLREMILQFSGLSTADLDTTSWDTAEATCTTRAYDTTGYFGGYIPLQAGQLEGAVDWEGYPNQWSVAQSIANSFNHVLYLTSSGTIGITSIDISELGTPETYYRHPEDFMDDLSIKWRPVPTVNEARVTFQTAHTADSGAVNYVRGYNTTSQAAFGVKEQTWDNRICQNSTFVRDVVLRRMQLASGAMRSAEWTTPGFWGIQNEVGDLVAISHPRGLGEWDEEQARVTTVSVDLLSGASTLSALMVGGNYISGSVAVSGETTVELSPDQDTWVKEEDGSSSYGTETELVHGEFVDYPDHYKRRAVYRFDMSSIPSTATVRNATLRLYATSYIRASQFQLRELTGGTSWNESSTWNSFSGGSAFTDGNIGGTQLAPYLGGGTGTKTFTLNSSGIAVLQTAVSASGNAHFTHQAMNYSVPYEEYEVIKIASSEHANEDWRPLLTVTYVN